LRRIDTPQAQDLDKSTKPAWCLLHIALGSKTSQQRSVKMLQAVCAAWRANSQAHKAPPERGTARPASSAARSFKSHHKAQHLTGSLPSLTTQQRRFPCNHSPPSAHELLGHSRAHQLLGHTRAKSGVPGLPAQICIREQSDAPEGSLLRPRSASHWLWRGGGDGGGGAAVSDCAAHNAGSRRWHRP